MKRLNLNQKNKRLLRLASCLWSSFWQSTKGGKMEFKEDDEVSKGRSRAVKLAALERDNHECRMCFGRMFLTNHHIIPLSHKNGKDELANSIILCRSCHDIIEGLYAKGVLIPSTCVPYVDFIAAELRSKQ